MSAPVTEAHRELARTIRLHLTLGQAYQLIADSEAKAVAELRALVGTIRSQLNLIPRNVGDITPAEHSHETGAAIDQLRAEVERLKEYSGNLENDVKYLTQGVPEGDPLFLAVARAERAEAELHALRLVCGTTDADKFSTWVDRAIARAEKAEAELAKAKAALASIEEDGTEEHNAAVRLRRELAAERARLDWLLSRMGGNVLPANKCVAWTVNVYHYGNRFPSRAAIDAAMKEGSA